MVLLCQGPGRVESIWTLCPQDFSRLLSGRENHPQYYVNERVWPNPLYLFVDTEI